MAPRPSNLALPGGDPTAPRLDARRIASLQRRLLAWYDEHRRPLPWRATDDPYAIWISEAMLQQTRVETVVPYWRAFLERFPTVDALAAASEQDVLAVWSGLGYYRRARALREAARVLVAEHGGRFPSDPEEVRSLPGVGPYTAGAILSIAFDLPEPVVDGNVARVLCRLFALEGDPSAGALRRGLWDLAGRLVPRRGRAGDWNQALMELGATTCAPRNAACQRCPLARSCAARRQDRVDGLPHAARRPPSVAVQLEILVVPRRGGLLVEQRPDGGRMAGLWQLPTRESGVPGRAPSGLFPARWPRGAGLVPGERLGEVRHGITHHRIRAEVRRAELSPSAGPPPDGWRWVESGRLPALGLTGMARKVLAAPFLAAVPAPGARRGARSAGGR